MINAGLETINTGQAANDGYGDPLRRAFAISHNNDIKLEDLINYVDNRLTTELTNINNRIDLEIEQINNRIDLEVDQINNKIIASGNYLETKINSLHSD